MNTICVDMAQSIGDAGYATLGTDMFIDVLPDRPNFCISLHETGTWQEPQAQVGLEYPLMQIIVRSKRGDYSVGRNKVYQLQSHILYLAPVTINGTFYGGTWVQSGPMSMGQDERHRPLVSINFRFMRSL